MNLRSGPTTAPRRTYPSFVQSIGQSAKRGAASGAQLIEHGLDLLCPCLGLLDARSRTSRTLSRGQTDDRASRLASCPAP